MPLRKDLKSVLVIGSGPIVIGQACEFDYSGTQACRVLRAEGMRVVLVNSNPATIMTDPEIADATYIEPLTVPVLTGIIERERPDALLATLGGQTALNAAVALGEAGVLEKYGVELIGASLDSILAGEDRAQFKQVVEDCGAEVARSAVGHTLEECREIAQQLGYPLVVRPSFTMGGLGSGMAYNQDDLDRIAGSGLHHSPTAEVLLEESILGWKEIELEVMRDTDDHAIVVCSIENFDPVGVHTGDSITVAPALTLTESEYQNLRTIGIEIIRRVGVDAGGCNIQFAVDPATGRVVVIEMNPRVSRSSALASKATGLPIAKVAARLALGYTLAEIPNDVTLTTSCAVEPTVDYVVVKVPRFAFEKFSSADRTITTTMKSVGESMAIGSTFTEAYMKALRSIDKPLVVPRWDTPVPDETEVAALREAMATPTETRHLEVARAMRGGMSPGEVFEVTGIDPWFADQLQLLNEVAKRIADSATLDPQVLNEAKRHGFSDVQIAQIRGIGEATVREMRHAYGLKPVYKTVDTCAAAVEAATPYHYSTYAIENEVAKRERPAVLILGSGPNRIGQGIEFDYSCVHAALALGEQYETVMINCNPETVSTDYDISDRLYFEPLTFEDVYEIYLTELEAGPVAGVIVSLGGQTPLSLASRLEEAGVPIMGTSPRAIEAAEDRKAFGQVLETTGLMAPAYGTATSAKSARAVAGRIGYPLLVRPSFVLGGAGMEIIYDPQGLDDYLSRNDPAQASIAAGRTAPLLIDKFLDDAIEIDVDALYDGEELFMGGLMEHIEEAGIHSGDSACVIPPVTLSVKQVLEARETVEKLARGIGVRGLINVQLALVHGVLYVIEANPRASRTVPFVAKATGIPLARAASLIMAGATIAQLREQGVLPASDTAFMHEDHPVAVKEAVLPFRRFRTVSGGVVDAILGPEMRSTGEVMGFDTTFPRAFAKSQAAAYGGLPHSGTVFVSVADRDKRAAVFPVSQLRDMGYGICSTEGTALMLRRYGIEAQRIRKVGEPATYEGQPSVVDLVLKSKVSMVVNTASGQGARADGYQIREAATMMDVPIITTVAEFGAAVQALKTRREQSMNITSMQEHAKRTANYQ